VLSLQLGRCSIHGMASIPQITVLPPGTQPSIGLAASWGSLTVYTTGTEAGQ
jgi:hypothetical protein